MSENRKYREDHVSLKGSFADLSENDDFQILGMMREGSEVALNLFFNKYMEVLYYKALGMVHDQLVAEDIVQEVFIRFWDNRIRLNISTSVLAYLIQAVTNACLNHIEHVEVEHRFAENYKKEFREEEEEYDLEELEELRSRVYDLLETFPDKCREIFILACVDGLKYREVAERLDVSVNTVKTQVKIAYQRLRAEFNERDRGLFVFLLLFHP